MSYLWKFERDINIPDDLWAMIILKRMHMGSSALFYPRIYRFFMVDTGLVIKAKKLKIAHVTKFNKFLYFLKSVCK